MGEDSSTLLDLIATPLLRLAAKGDVVADLNAAAHRILAAGRPPLLLDSLLGTAAAAAVRSRLPNAGRQLPDPFDLRCETAVGPLHLRFSVDGTPGEEGGWVIGIEDRSAPASDPHIENAWRETLLQVLDQLPVGLEIYDDTFVELFANRETLELFGYGSDEIGSLDDWWVVGYPDPLYRAEVQSAWDEAVERSRRTQTDVLVRDLFVTCKDGSRKTIQARYRAIGEHHVLVYWDMTGRRRLEQELRRAAETDALTGLCDRRRFFVEAATMLAGSAATGRPLSLLMLDVDHFKAINDRLGHAGGDEVLRAVARRLLDAVRTEDLVARIGGEEFAVLLPGIDTGAAALVAERIRRALSDTPVVYDGDRLTVRASIGGATRADGDETVDQLLDRADRALYGAKRNGRDRVGFADAPR